MASDSFSFERDLAVRFVTQKSTLSLDFSEVYPIAEGLSVSMSKEEILLTTRFVVKNTDGSRKRGSREGEGVFPLSAGSLETRGFVLCGVKLGLTPAFFA